MKLGDVGKAPTLCRQLAGTASEGSRGSRSHRLALDTTALRAAMVAPLLSRTPATCKGGQGGRVRRRLACSRLPGSSGTPNAPKRSNQDSPAKRANCCS